MRRWRLLLGLALLLSTSPGFGLELRGVGIMSGGGAPLTITEIDNAPSGTPTTLKFSNDAVTDNGDGSFTVVTGAGGGGDASTNTATSVDNELTLFSGTGGKTLKRATTTGLLKGTSGVLSAAVAGTDYVVPAGNVATATALAANPSDCGANTYATTIAASGNLTCAQVSLSAGVTGTLPNGNTTATSANTTSAIVARDGSGNFSAGTITAALSGNASTATALASNPTDCSAGEVATAIAASGNLTCTKVKHVEAFTDETGVTVAGVTHGLGTVDMLIQCWDGSAPRQLIPIVDATVDTDDFDVVLTFSTAQTGRCVFLR